MKRINKQLAKEIDFSLLDTYYDAIYQDVHCAEPYDLELFREEHPKEYAFFSSVARSRKKVYENLEALQDLKETIYFGTLTFNNEKDKNKIECKRKEAFKVLNTLFRFFLIIEELGEEKERYHIHFVGVYRKNKGFNDFVDSWHSRQNIEPVKSIEKVSAYLVKYVSKQLPRIRRNKALVKYQFLHKKCKKVRKSWCYDKEHWQDNKWEKERLEILQMSLDGLI